MSLSLTILKLYALIILTTKVQKQINQRKAIYANCITDLKLFDDKYFPINVSNTLSQFENLVHKNEINSELMQNMNICIEKYKKDLVFNEKERTYETSQLFWIMSFAHCVSVILGFLLGRR
jgi:hypothetical protein